MRQTLAFLASIAAAALMTWAGLHYDRALFDGGVILLVFVLVLWLWAWGKPEPKAVASGAQAGPQIDPAKKAARARQNLSADIAMTVRNARSAMADNVGVRTAERQLQHLHAILLTLNKEKGIPLPPKNTNPMMGFEMACRMLERIQPLIERGHDDEARHAAQDFLDRINPPKKD
jgi:hypothetical protein